MIHFELPPLTSPLAVGALVAMSIAISPTRSQGQRRSALFEQWAAAHAIPLDNADNFNTTADLRQLSSVIGSRRIVAFGEPVHGAHEPLAFRNRLFRYLVEELGFTAIAIESGLPESRHVQAFVEGGAGAAPQIAHQYISYEFGDWRENVELIQWMRDYNANPAHRKKIRFYGFDLSLGGSGGATPRPAPFEIALSLLGRADSAAAHRLHEALHPILRLPPDPYPSLTDPERNAVILAVDELLSRLERSRPSLLKITSAADYEWGHRSAVVAQQIARMIRMLPADISAGVPPSSWEPVEVRDAGMADNVRWVLSREGPTGRVLIFAHNAHVMNAPWRGSGVWNVFARPPNGLGVHLRSTFGSDLLIIGSSSAANGTGLPAATLDSSSLDASFARVGRPRFALDLRAAQSNRDVRDWLTESRLLRANFTDYYNVQLASAFDAFVFIDTLTPAAVFKSSP